MIREIDKSELGALLALYKHLKDEELLLDDDGKKVWEEIFEDKNYHIIVAEEEGEIVSSCTLVIIPNLTHHHHPYALIENVVTHKSYRGRGLATDCLDYASKLAEKKNCYKILLLTGSKQESTLNFYRRAGFNSEDKTAFIKWLK